MLDQAARDQHEEILAGLAKERPHSRIKTASGQSVQWTYSGNGKMIQLLDWKNALTHGLFGTNFEFEAWKRSPERLAMMAEANGKTALSYYEAGITGMAGGYAKIAARYAFQALAQGETCESCGWENCTDCAQGRNPGGALA